MRVEPFLISHGLLFLPAFLYDPFLLCDSGLASGVDQDNHNGKYHHEDADPNNDKCIQASFEHPIDEANQWSQPEYSSQQHDNCILHNLTASERVVVLRDRLEFGAVRAYLPLVLIFVDFCG